MWWKMCLTFLSPPTEEEAAHTVATPPLRDELVFSGFPLHWDQLLDQNQTSRFSSGPVGHLTVTPSAEQVLPTVASGSAHSLTSAATISNWG